MYRLNTASRASIAILGSVLFTSSTLLAQDADLVIEEIIVTAQKRAQDIQDVPMAITAFDEQTIEKARILGLNDIAERTPNFYIGQQTPGEPELTIRGVGSTARQSGSDRSVVVFVDEVYIGRAGGSAFDLFDLERIEVLRGPQGTLFGRNVVGGLVHIVTKKPSAERYARVQTTLGNYQLLEFKGVVNSPLSDNLFGKVSFSTRDRDGVNDNTFSGNEIEDTNSRSLRGQLKYDPGEDFQALFSLEYSRDEVQGIGTRPLNAAGAFSVVGFVPADNFNEFQNPVDGFLDRDIYGFSGRFDWETGLGTATSISAYRVVDFIQDSDAAGAPGSPNFLPVAALDPTVPGFLSRLVPDERSETFTQEFRLTSNADDANHHWTVGAYFLSEKTDRRLERMRNLTRTNGAITSSHPLFDQTNDTDSLAVFGQFTYEFSDQWELTVGARQTWDDKKMDIAVVDLDPDKLNTNSLNPAVEEFVLVSDADFNAFTPKATINFFPNEDLMLYASVAKGYKSGGFNGTAGGPQAVADPFEEETAWNYEIGFKSQFLDDRVQFNATAFFLEFRDLQLRQRLLLVPGDQGTNTLNVVNAAKAEIQGIEADFIALLFPGFTLSGNIGYQDSELTDATLKSSLPGLDPDGLAPSQGERLPRAPELTYSIQAEYAIPAANGQVLLRVGDRFTDEVFFDLGEPFPGGHQDSYHLLDASISYVPNDSAGWEFKLWAKNLFDKEYTVWQQAVSGGRTAIVRIGDPVTYGVSVTWNWEE